MNDPRSVGLLGLDFDGTLLRSDGSISGRTKAALSAAGEQGWLVVGATGRPPALAAEVTALLTDELTHLVTNNGSLTITANGDIVDQISCSSEDARWAGFETRALVADVGLAVDHVDGDQTWELGLAERVPKAPIGAMVDDALATISGEVRKLLVYSKSVELDDLYAVVRPALESRLDVTYSGLPFLEVGPFGVSKASALQKLAIAHEVDHTNTIVFGDARNDHEMLRWAGVGVAMGNADAETKALANFVTESNNDEGVALYIEQLLSRSG